MVLPTTRAAGGNSGGPLLWELWELRPLAAFALPLLLWCLAGLAWPGPARGASPGDAAACRAIPDDADRLRCYDAAVDSTAARPASEALPARATATPAPALNAEVLFGKPADESRALAARELGIPDADVMAATIAGVERSAAGKLMIKLTNGQAWAQLDTVTLQLAAGDPVRIRRAALGSYLLQKQSGGRSLRVRRTE